MIEKLVLKKHLKCGNREFCVGTYTHPIPEEILSEVKRGDLIEILQSQSSPPPITTIKPSVWANNKPKEDIVKKETKPKESKPKEPVVRRARRAK
jgi:hypothetical protein